MKLLKWLRLSLIILLTCYPILELSRLIVIYANSYPRLTWQMEIEFIIMWSFYIIALHLIWRWMK